MAYQYRGAFLDYNDLSWATKLSYGFNPNTYYKNALNVETDPIVRQQYQDALTSYESSKEVRGVQGSGLGLLFLGLFTGNPVLVTAGAGGYSQAQQAAAGTGQLPAPSGAYYQQAAAGSVQSYVDDRVKLGLVIAGVIGAGVLIFFMARKK